MIILHLLTLPTKCLDGFLGLILSCRYMYAMLQTCWRVWQKHHCVTWEQKGDAWTHWPTSAFTKWKIELYSTEAKIETDCWNAATGILQALSLLITTVFVTSMHWIWIEHRLSWHQFSFTYCRALIHTYTTNLKGDVNQELYRLHR